MQAITIEASEVRVDNVIAFYYNGDSRCMRVEKVTDTYVQGKMLPWDDVLPNRRFGTFSFSRFGSPIELVERVGGNSELSRFDLADVR